MHGLSKRNGSVRAGDRWQSMAMSLCLIGLMATSAWAQAPGLGASVELVDPKVLRVCADPRSMPFSNEAGEGFEDKLAQMFATKLGKSVSFTYFPRATGFIRATLNALRCDVVMGDSQGDELVQNTNPYYRAFYTLVIRPGTGLDDIQSLGDPRLRGRRIGLIAGTPPATVFAENGMLDLVKSFPLMVDTRFDGPSKSMIDEIAAGTLDAGVLWGPIAGFYAKKSNTKLVVIPLLNETAAPMDFRISMAVRRSDQEWKRTLNKLILENQGAINTLLIGYGIPIVDEKGREILK